MMIDSNCHHKMAINLGEGPYTSNLTTIPMTICYTAKIIHWKLLIYQKSLLANAQSLEIH